MTKLTFALAIAFLVAGGGAAVPSQGGLPQPSPPNDALAKWKDFPATATPRPIISFGDTVDEIQANGFPPGDSKMAWVCHRFVLAAGLSVPAAAPAKAFGGGFSYPAISATRAWSDLTAQPAGANPACDAAAHNFVVTAVRFATAGFWTDRGTMQMSAWLFDIPEADGYIGRSAVDPSAYWGGAVTKSVGHGYRISADGRTVSIEVGNAEPGPCGSDYTASAAESVSAVAISVKQIPHARPSDSYACLDVFRPSNITVTLEAPLGGRVLVDENGNVGSVCPETGGC